MDKKTVVTVSHINKHTRTFILVVNELIQSEHNFSEYLKSMDTLLKNPQHLAGIQKIAKKQGIDDATFTKLFTELAKHVEILGKTAPFCENMQEIDPQDSNALVKAQHFLEQQQNQFTKVATSNGKSTIERHISMASLILFYKAFAQFNAAVNSDKDLNIITALNHKKQDWSSIMIQPAQRLARYPLLLKECQNNIAKAQAEHSKITGHEDGVISQVVQLVQQNLNFYTLLANEIDLRIAISSARKPFQTQIEMIQKTLIDQEKNLTEPAQEKKDLAADSQQKLKSFANALDNLHAEQLSTSDSDKIGSILTTLQSQFAQLKDLTPGQVDAVKDSIQLLFTELTATTEAIKTRASSEKMKSANLVFFQTQSNLIRPLLTNLPVKFAADIKKSIYTDNVLTAFKENSRDRLSNPVLSVVQSAIQHVSSVYEELNPKVLDEPAYKTMVINTAREAKPDLDVPPTQTSKMVVSVCQTHDSQNLASQFSKQGNSNIFVMNAMNSINAGGGWTRGGGTQEESLMFTTDLHKRIYPLTTEKEAIENRFAPYKQRIAKPLATPPNTAIAEGDPINALYVPNVICFRKADNLKGTMDHDYKPCDPFAFNVFSIAGYDLRILKKTNPAEQHERDVFTTKGSAPDTFDWELFEEKTAELYELAIITALNRGDRIIIAVPLSCGAFSYQEALPYPKDSTLYNAQKSKEVKMTSEHVANAFVKVLKKYEKQLDAINAEVHMVAINTVVAPEFNKALANAQLLTPAVTAATPMVGSATPIAITSAAATATTTAAVTTVSSLAPASATATPVQPSHLQFVASTVAPAQLTAAQQTPAQTPVAQFFSSLSSIFSENGNGKKQHAAPLSAPIGLQKLSAVTNHLDFTFKPPVGAPAEGLRTEIGRAIFFALNPSVSIETSSKTRTQQLCAQSSSSSNASSLFSSSIFSSSSSSSIFSSSSSSSSSQNSTASYMVDLTYSGFSIALPNKDKMEQFASDCTISGVTCRTDTHSEPGKHMLYIPRSDLPRFFAFIFHNPQLCLKTMHDVIIKCDAASIDQAAAMWQKIKPDNHHLPEPVQDFYIATIIKILKNDKIDPQQFSANRSMLLQRFSTLNQSGLMMDFEKLNTMVLGAQMAQAQASITASTTAAPVVQEPKMG